MFDPATITGACCSSLCCALALVAFIMGIVALTRKNKKGTVDAAAAQQAGERAAASLDAAAPAPAAPAADPAPPRPAASPRPAPRAPRPADPTAPSAASLQAHDPLHIPPPPDEATVLYKEGRGKPEDPRPRPSPLQPPPVIDDLTDPRGSPPPLPGQARPSGRHAPPPPPPMTRSVTPGPAVPDSTPDDRTVVMPMRQRSIEEAEDDD